MRLLVTGGAGFIGSNFIRYWLKKYPKDKIVNLDKLTYAGHLSSTRDFSEKPNYKFIRGDICNRILVEKLVKDVDFVVHFAAESHVDRSISKADNFLRTNIFGTYVLLKASLRFKIKRFHHVSTDEVFGSLTLNSKDKFDENFCYNPRNPYAASKAASDHLVRAFHNTYGLNVTISNCSNNFGPFQDPEKFIPRAITNLIEGRKIPIYGDGRYIRDWLYVEDHCRAIDLVLRYAQPGESFVVGGMRKDVTNLDIAKKILKFFRKGLSFLEFVKDRPGHDRRYSVNWSKIEKELGWKPKFDFEYWLEKTCDWYQKNVWWWKPLKKERENFYRKDEKISLSQKF